MTFNQITTTLRNAGFDPWPYAGRDIYGPPVVGVTVKSGDTLPQGLPEHKKENLGRDQVYYWSDIEWLA